MATRDDIKKEIEYLMVCFPNYNPVLEGDINVVNIFLEKFGKYPTETFKEAIRDCTDEPGRKFAPSVGEIIHAIKELPFKGMTPSERFEKENGIRPAYEVLQEMGIYDLSDAEQKIKNQKLMQRKDTPNEPTF
jgi:hypothetical protein